jgi:superfamily II DNA or RNA helicase
VSDFNPYDAEFVEEGAAPAFALRGRQPEWIDAMHRDEAAGFRRNLVVAPPGVGKTSVMAFRAKQRWDAQNVRTLITENREHLVEQTAERVRSETGLEVDIEMASQNASPHAQVVVGSAQTLGRINRLTSFAPDHFGDVVADECHLSLAPQNQRILSYFHYGASSLAEGWSKPKDGEYNPLSTVWGYTGSPNLGAGRSLGEWYHRVSVNYPLLDAVDEGWLVGYREINVPVSVDTRKFRTRRTSEGSDFNVGDQSAAIIPIIKELAEQIVRYASNGKTICFLPSVECARLMAETLNGMGMRAIFASGECLDKGEKTRAYNAAGPGTVFCNCSLVTYGIDFVDTDFIAPFCAMISKCRYVQSLGRGGRVLPGVLQPGMTAEQRKAAIARSAKPFCTILSPFFLSDRLDICEIFDLFTDAPHPKKKRSDVVRDLSTPEKARDWVKSLEKAADPHQNRQPRTIDPIKFGLMIGADAMAHYQPESAADAAPPSKAELDYLLSVGASTVDIKNSGEAQLLIQRLRGRERLGLATPKTIHQLTLRLGWPAETASMMKQKQAAMLMVRGVRYKRPVEAPTACYCNATSHPPCSFCESGAGDGF